MSADPRSTDSWVGALSAMHDFAGRDLPVGRGIADLETTLRGVSTVDVQDALDRSNVTAGALDGALVVKELASQVHVVVHALGIALSLNYILEPGERIEDVSLGAGNTGRSFDLETDRRVAEFKFIRWKGGAKNDLDVGVCRFQARHAISMASGLGPSDCRKRLAHRMGWS